MRCCSVSCSGSGAPPCWLSRSCWPEHAPGLIGTAEHSPATARGLNEKRASLSGSACEYRRLLAVAAVGCHLLGDFGSNRLRVGSSLGMEAMKAQAIVFDDDFGRSLIVYRTGVFCWSYSVNGVPVGKTFLTRKRAVKAALSKSALLPKRS
jgi:hypothetical protein